MYKSHYGAEENISATARLAIFRTGKIYSREIWVFRKTKK